MLKFTRFSFGLITMVLMASCYQVPPNLNAITSGPFVIACKKIVIADYTSEQNNRGGETGWKSGFAAAPYASTVPPISEFVLQSLSANLKGNGDNQAGQLEITVLNANLLQEYRAADTIPFVGIASSLSERKYIFRLDANFRYGDKMVRKTFEVVDNKSRAWSDLPPTEKSAMLEKLVGQIVGEIASFSSEFVK
jgi:hypothetical protein